MPPSGWSRTRATSSVRADRQAIESAIEDLKKAIERNDVGEMKRAMEALNTAQHKAAEAMYRTAGAAGAPGAERAAGRSPRATRAAAARADGDVIDAEVVEEEKK